MDVLFKGLMGDVRKDVFGSIDNYNGGGGVLEMSYMFIFGEWIDRMWCE